MFKFKTGVLIAATIAAATGPAFAQQPATAPAKPATSDTGQSPSPAGARAYIINPKNGDTVTSPFKVQFGLTSNMGIAPAGTDKENVGHHHLLIDTTLTPEELTQPLMSDEKHIHYGKGQTEAMVTLPPGKHTLQLELGNWTHIPFNPPVQSEVITITVADPAKPAAAAATKEAPKVMAVTKPTPVVVTKDAPKQASQEVKKDAPVPVAQDIKPEAPKDTAKDAPKDTSKEVKAETPKAADAMHHRHHHRRWHHYRYRRHHLREQYLHT
ncbi:DUF4399 domain-containing protein [Bradyrhizobium sp.]|uniref:DUF4399 domain-containing protein n=1 Tax=Bradyrhizobium sp. TaxID=376 RepID=UPI003C5F48E8